MANKRRIKASSAAKDISLYAPITIQAAADDKGPAKFSMTAYTGVPMWVAGFGDPIIINLKGFDVSRQSRPVLKQHNPDQVAGHTTSIRIEGNQVLVEGVFSASNDVSREIVAAAANGFPWQASIGASVREKRFVPMGRKARVNGRDHEGPLIVAEASISQEFSIVPLGADDDTSVKIAAKAANGSEDKDMDFEKWLNAMGLAAEELTDDQTTKLKAKFDKEQAAIKASESNGSDDAGGDTGDTGGGDSTPAENESLQAAVERAEKAIRAEYERCAKIREICAGKNPDIEAKAIAEKWSAERAELEILRAARPKPNVITGSGNASLPAPTVIEAAMAMRCGVSDATLKKHYTEPVLNAASERRWNGFGLHALMHEVCAANGEHLPHGRIGNDAIRAAFTADGNSIRAGFSTVSMSGTLSNLANKLLLDAYSSVNIASTQFAAVRDNADFKTATRYRMTGVGLFEEVGPDGEIKHGTVTEEQYSAQVKAHAKMLALTREMMVNDDLGAFTQIPQLLGRQAALALDNKAFTLLLSNPSNFFHTNNKNYISGSDTALSVAGLKKAWAALRSQVDSEGKPIALTPGIILCGVGNEVEARLLMTERLLNEAATAGDPRPVSNPFVGQFRVVSSPFLDAQGISGASSTAWYLLANPSEAAVMEVSFLRGQRTPIIESAETDFNTLGMQWRGVFDFGVAMQDTRGGIKSKGVS